MPRILRLAAPPLLAALLFSAALDSHNRVSTQLSWDEDAGRIVQARCAGCHTAAPDLRTYAAARPWARAMREAMLDGHGYSARNGNALTPFERELLVRWIDGGAPERAKFIPDDFYRLPGRYVRIASANPLETLDAHHARRGGTRQIVPGLGLALRTPEEIVIFERGAGSERVIARGTIVPSIAAHLAALPASTPRTRISDTAYAIGAMTDPRVEVAEVAPEGPDRFWCPMHPEVRSPAPGTCPRCAMALVEMPALSLDGFNMEVVKAEPAGRRMRVALRVTRGPKQTPVTTFVTLHERPFHLFVVDDTLELFDHVHPEISGNTVVVTIDERRDRNYWLVGDFMPADGFPQMRMVRLPKNADAGAGIGGPPPSSMRVSLRPGEMRAGREARLAFDITDAQTGAAPVDLEPYLGAAAHLFVIDTELRDPIHAHPVDVDEGGIAQPAFDVRFPRAGRYVMWLQVQRAGRVETLRFTADVSN